jgi:CHAD domain-containing protein
VATSRHDEVERKYDVGAAAVFPSLTDLAELDGVSTIGRAVEHELEAVYFDTADFVLAQHGTTLRRRTGGDDAGWHLKLARQGDTRTELHLPLGRATKTVPKELLTPARWLVRNRRLGPVVRVRTHRLVHTLLDADGRALVHLCDDEVRTQRLDGASGSRSWREWEVELVDGPPALLDAVEVRLIAAGATSASVHSKLARSLGDAVPAPRYPAEISLSRKELSRSSAAAVVRVQLTQQIAELHEQDARLRTDEPGSVHRLRIAARRLRSVLRTYVPLLDPGAADAVGEELRWLGQSLADARDAQVLRERLHDLVSSEPPELVLGPVSARIDDELSTAYRSGREQALAALDSDRYFRLLDDLDELLATTPLTAEADTPAAEVLPRLLRRDTKRLRRAVRRIADAQGSEQHDAALHEARKKAKRLRYAAESTVPVLGKRAKTLATASKDVQQALGRHQDSVVARTWLREYGVQTHLNGENTFTVGRLHALEQARAEQAEREFETAWKALRSKKLRRPIHT